MSFITLQTLVLVWVVASIPTGMYLRTLDGDPFQFPETPVWFVFVLVVGMFVTWICSIVLFLVYGALIKMPILGICAGAVVCYYKMKGSKKDEI